MLRVALLANGVQSLMRILVCALAASLFSSVGISSYAGQQESPRQPVPNESVVKAARELVRDAYEGEFLNAASSPEPLIEKLVTASGQTKDAARAYAMLLEAEQVAVMAGKYDRVIELVDIRTREFDVDPAQERVTRLEELFTAQARRDPAALSSLFGHAMETGKLALQQESIDQAAAAADLSGRAAKGLYLLGKAKKAQSLVSDGESKQLQAKELTAEITTRKELLAGYEKARAVLEDSPDDPDANQTVGAYLCFCRDDWGSGLPALVKSGDKSLAELAALEQAVMAAETTDPQQLFDLAGKWWAISQTRGEPAIQRHAAAIYEKCVADLTDPLEKALAEKRLATGNGSSHVAGGAVVTSMDRVLRRPVGVDRGQAAVPDVDKSLPPPLRRLSWSVANEPCHVLFQPTTRCWYVLSATDKNWYRFEEVSRNKDYVEVFDKGRNMLKRLWADKAEWASRDNPTKWNLWKRGGWTDEQETVRLAERFRPTARLVFFPFEGKQKANAAEAKQMLEWLGATEIMLHQGGLVTAELDRKTEVAIWPQTYNQEYCYGIRYGDSALGRSYFSSNDTYFEICRPQ